MSEIYCMHLRDKRHTYTTGCESPHSPEQTLQKAVHDILNTCGQANEQAKGSEPAAHVDEKQVALLLSKA